MKIRIIFACLSCLTLMIFVGGCSKTDADVLAGIGRKIAERTYITSDSAGPAWMKAPTQMVLELRVKNRLRWDKTLTHAVIEVKAADKTVELKGKVATLEQIRRAGELAESTVGVEKIVNSLTSD